MKFVWPRQPREIDNSSTPGHVKLCSIREDMFSSMASHPLGNRKLHCFSPGWHSNDGLQVVDASF